MKTNIAESGITVDYVSDLYEAGLTEDGDAFIGERYYVVAEDEKGNRWSLRPSFAGVEVVDCEDHWAFRDVRPQAIEKVQALVDRIRAAGEIDLDCWCESRPAYGSEAYQQYGAADDYAEERARG